MPPRRTRRALLSSFLLLLLGACEREVAQPTGAALYQQYCASCHGPGGRGDGPVVAALRQPPPDLTTLAQRAGGRFDERHVMTIIDGERMLAAHGSREMPVWGAVFDKELQEAPFGVRVRLLRSQILADYLRTLQR